MSTMVWMLVAVLAVITPASAGAAGPAFTGHPTAVAEIKAVFENFSRVKSYRGRMMGAGMDGAASTFEWAAPSQMRMVSKAGGKTFEMVVIGDKGWMKAEGQCRAMPNARSLAEAPTDRIWGQYVKAIRVTKGGMQALDGAAVQGYLLEVTGTDGKTSKNTTYVDVRSRLPKRIEVLSDDGKKIQMDYFDYNAPVKITPPC